MPRWPRPHPPARSATSACSGQPPDTGQPRPAPGTVSDPAHGLVAAARDWLGGARPRTLPAAVVPVVVGSGVAFGYGRFSLWRAALALVVALALQIGVNFANDYSDGVRGSDSAERRVGPMRLVGSGLASPRQVKLAAFGCFFVACGA